MTPMEEMYCRELDRWVNSFIENRKLRAELAEAREQIAAYQVRVDNDALRLNSAHPVTADRFSHE